MKGKMNEMRPQSEEYPGYYNRYITSVQECNPIELIMSQGEEYRKSLQALPTGKWEYRYATGKWSIKEMWTHVIDTERIMAYRALRIARNDKVDLPGFEQDDYVIASEADMRDPQSIINEYEAVRKSSYLLFSQLPEERLLNIGTIDSNEVSVRALLYIILGHEQHHMKVLRSRYE